jgi:hypothetical protein
MESGYENKPMKYDATLTQSFFHEQALKYPELLRQLNYVITGGYPYSKRLEKILDVMFVAGVLVKTSKEADLVYIDPTVRKYYDKYIESMSTEELDMVKNASSEFKRKLTMV